MKRRVRADPNYPFSDANLEATVHEIDRFVADPPLSGGERGQVLEFVRLTRQYAFLEKLIQGEVLCDLPVYLELLGKTNGLDEAAAEQMGQTEQELLALGIEPADAFVEALTDRGIKVFHRSQVPESEENLTGGFHYDGETGPALLGGGVEGCPDATFVIAHEYGHLVMDVSPYRSRFCRWNRADLRNENDSIEERRADRFARALLLPATTVQAFAPELGLDDTTGGSAHEVIRRAADAFGVAPALLWRRLADLNLPRPAEPPEPLPREECREVDDRRPTDLPERFVNLALAAFGQRILGKNELAHFLRIPPSRVEKFLAWCPIPRTLKRPAPGDDVMEGEEPDE